MFENFNETVTNNIVSFEQLGPGFFLFLHKMFVLAFHQNHLGDMILIKYHINTIFVDRSEKSDKTFKVNGNSYRKQLSFSFSFLPPFSTGVNSPRSKHSPLKVDPLLEGI